MGERGENGRKGLFPFTHVKIIDPQNPDEERAAAAAPHLLLVLPLCLLPLEAPWAGPALPASAHRGGPARRAQGCLQCVTVVLSQSS